MNFIKRWSSPKRCYELSGKLTPWFAFISFCLMSYGVAAGLFWAPTDHQQGDGFRMIYIHVPAAFLSLMIYAIIFIHSVIFMVWHIKLADQIANNSALMGATFTVIALVSGALWGKPMWGTWWIWDARLTSELILLFLYFGYMGLRSAIRDPIRSAKAGAIIAIVGMVDIPIVHFSVEWWATLHQGATLAKLTKPSIANAMLYPLLAMIAAFFFFFVALLSFRVRSALLKREWQSNWAREKIVSYGGLK